MPPNDPLPHEGPPYIRHTAGRSLSYRRIGVKRLTPVIGAEVDGVDLRRPIDDELHAELRQALADHLVIFFRDQSLTPEQHVAAGRRFGEVLIHPSAKVVPEHPELMIVATDESSSAIVGDTWHTDLSWTPLPPMGSMLHLKECPPEGGDTLFANMYAAFEALPAQVGTRLEGLQAVHVGGRAYPAGDGRVAPRAVHPVVRIHPWTGRKCLYVNPGFTTEIVGVPAETSRAILAQLFAHMAQPLFQCRFRWTPDAVAFWDNRCSQHLAVWDYWPHRRFGHRVTIAERSAI